AMSAVVNLRSSCRSSIVSLLHRDRFTQKFLEEGAVTHDGLAEILGRRLAVSGPLRDLVRPSIVVDDAGMVYRDVGSRLLEAADGIPRRLHGLGDEPIGVRDGAVRVVGEVRLHLSPLARETRARRRVEVADLQVRHPLRPRLELRFCLVEVRSLANRAVVFGTELTTQAIRPASLVEPHADACRHEQRQNDEYRDHPCVHDTRSFGDAYRTETKRATSMPPALTPLPAHSSIGCHAVTATRGRPA